MGVSQQETPASFTAPAAFPGADCESGWTYREDDNGGCGWCYTQKSRNNWVDAEAACVADGAHLASLHSTEEREAVAELCTSGHGCWYG